MSISLAMAVGLVLLCTGAALIGMSMPTLISNPAFTAYSYEGSDVGINLMLQLMIVGAMLFPFGLIFISKGRKKKAFQQK